MSEPITHALGQDRRWKLCRCGTCGQSGQCTPEFDFYATKEDGRPLECEACLRSRLRAKGYRWLGEAHPERGEEGA